MVAAVTLVAFGAGSDHDAIYLCRWILRDLSGLRDVTALAFSTLWVDYDWLSEF